MALRASLATILIALGLATGCRARVSMPPPAAAAERPNILFIIADDASTHFGAYATPWVETPAFDRIAREGILFANAYTPNAKCAPSRAVVLTGRNSWQLEEAGNHLAFFPEKFKGYVEALADHGYFVGHTGKGWGPGIAEIGGKPRPLTGPSFDRHRLTPPARGISNKDYAANFATFLDARAAGQPFAFWFGAHEPHRRYEFGAGLAAGKRLSDVGAVPPFWPDNDTVRTDMLDYAVEVEHFDRQVGHMLAMLEERGLLENTLVVVTSDNGMPFPRAKGFAYELSTHMPLAAMWPAGIRNTGRTVEDYVSFIDLAPTFLEVAGVSEEASGMQPITGWSLTDIFYSERDGRVSTARDHVLLGQERHDVGRPGDVGYPIRGIVKDGFLYLRNYEPDRWPAGNPEAGYLNTDGGPTKTSILNLRRAGTDRHYWRWSFGKSPEEQLYDLARDRANMNDLADEPALAARRDALRAQLEAELREQGDPRMFERGHLFDRYPVSAEPQRGFYERRIRGEPVQAGWVSDTDYEAEPIRDP